MEHMMPKVAELRQRYGERIFLLFGLYHHLRVLMFGSDVLVYFNVVFGD